MKTVVAKVVFAGMLLMWALPFHANAAFPQTCANPTAYSQCMNGCFSNMGTCVEYCTFDDNITYFSVTQYFWNPDLTLDYKQVVDFGYYANPSTCPCAATATNCANNCVSDCN